MGSGTEVAKPTGERRSRRWFCVHVEQRMYRVMIWPWCIEEDDDDGL